MEVLEEFDLTGQGAGGRPGQTGGRDLPAGAQRTGVARAASALSGAEIRDEAHRFAITYHRNLRRKEQTKSV
ncbi:MAG: hypothetical protein R3A10_22430 [Caldilineaceae bacterium]